MLDAVKDVDALIIRSDKVTSEVLNAAPNLKIVVRAGAGYDNVDLATSKSKGVVVMNTPGQNSNAVAELAIGMMIFMARNQFTPGTGSEIKGKKCKITITTHDNFSLKRMAGDDFKKEHVLDLPFSYFFPERLKNPRLAEGQTWKAVVDENFLLIYNPEFEPSKTYTVILDIE